MGHIQSDLSPSLNQTEIIRQSNTAHNLVQLKQYRKQDIVNLERKITPVPENILALVISDPWNLYNERN